MSDPNDPHADEWKRALAAGNSRSRRGLIVPVASILTSLLVLGAWVYAYHDETYVYVNSGRDASWAILKRGILLAGAAGFVVVFVLVRVLGIRENAYTKALFRRR